MIFWIQGIEFTINIIEWVREIWWPEILWSVFSWIFAWLVAYYSANRRVNEENKILDKVNEKRLKFIIAAIWDLKQDIGNQISNLETYVEKIKNIDEINYDFSPIFFTAIELLERYSSEVFLEALFIKNYKEKDFLNIMKCLGSVKNNQLNMELIKEYQTKRTLIFESYEELKKFWNEILLWEDKSFMNDDGFIKWYLEFKYKFDNQSEDKCIIKISEIIAFTNKVSIFITNASKNNKFIEQSAKWKYTYETNKIINLIWNLQKYKYQIEKTQEYILQHIREVGGNLHKCKAILNDYDFTI